MLLSAAHCLNDRFCSSTDFLRVLYMTRLTVHCVVQQESLEKIAPRLPTLADVIAADKKVQCCVQSRWNMQWVEHVCHAQYHRSPLVQLYLCAVTTSEERRCQQARMLRAPLMHFKCILPHLWIA